MNKKILLALLGLALGSCGGPAPSSSSNPPAGSSSDIGSSSASESSTDSGTASSDSGSASTSDSSASSSDSGSGGGSSSDSGSSSSSSGGESSGGDSSGSDSSQQDPSAAKKEKIVTFLTADDGGFNGGVFTVKTSILSPLQISMGQYLQNILQTQEMTATYQSVGKKAASELVAGGSFLVEVGNCVVAYQELKTAMGSQLPPVPDGVDVNTEDGAVAYFKYFLEAMYSSMAGKQVECDHKVENGFNVYTIEGSETLSDATYIDEKTDKLDFYRYDSYNKATVHGSAPLHTEDFHEIYRSPLGGNFMGYARTHLEKIEAAIVEDAASGVFTIKFSELAKDPDAAEVKVFGNSPLSYVPDLTVSFDASGSISGFAGSMEQAQTKVEVKATLAKTGGSVTIPTNVIECDHSYPAVRTFETEDGVGGHCHYCIQCHSVFDYGPHEYHEGDEHCHVCDYVETVEAPFKQGVVLPEALSGVKIIESKATGNFLRVECPDDMFRSTEGTPLEGNYRVEFETQIKDGEDSYHVLAVGTQMDGQAGCLYPMHWVVSYTKNVGDEPGTPVVIYEKISMLEYHETQPKKIDGMGDACHVYTVGECKVCHQEYGFPQMELDHKVEKKANQDGTYTITCSKCHESAVVSAGKAEPIGEEGHGVSYEYVSGNREVYEFFRYHTYLEDHVYVYEDDVGTCTVCGYETTRKQVVVDLSSYVGEEATITLFLDKDRGQQVNATASTSFAVPMPVRDPDSGEYHQGFCLLSNLSFIVVAEPVSMPVLGTTCDYTETWQIAVYPIEEDKESQEYVIAGEALDTFEDPWDPAEVKHHQHTHETYTPTGEGCVYDGKFVCDACGEIVNEFTISLHEISVSKENEAYRLTCEHCHASVLVDSYLAENVTDTYHAYRINGEILEASSPEFEKEAMAGLFASHSFDEEGNCVCGVHREDKMTNYVWAHNLSAEDPIDVAGGVNITRDETGKATAATLYGQGEEDSHNAESNYEEWNYKAVDSDGKEIGLIQEIKHYVPFEDHVVMSEHLFSLSLTGIEGDVSYYALTDDDAQTPDYKTFGVLIAYELSGASEGVAGRINFQYEVEEGSKTLTGISYEGVGDAIPSLTKIDELEEGQRIDIKAFQIVDTDGNGLNYCFISEVHEHLDGEDWVKHETVYYIADFDPDNPASDISLMDLREVAHY